MFKTIDDAAELSVARGCGFGALGIVTFMVALSDQMPLALKSGGILTLGMCLILIARGCTAKSTPYKRTEVWLMLAAGDRPQAPVAQKLIGNALHRVYLRYALQSGVLACAMLIGSVVLKMFGRLAA